jgi:glycosyltransferase involved in cell wall biosynthesis
MVLRVRQYVDEVIVFDDGSVDGTAEVARLAGATVVRHDTNHGYGATIQNILAEAKKRPLKALVLIDADYQHNPDDIPRLIKPIDDGFDLVIGSRESQNDGIPRYRRIGQGILSSLTHLLSGENIGDTECGYRVFSQKAINALKLSEKGMAVSAEMVAEAVRKNLRIIQVPVSITYTEDGSTLNPIMHGVGVLVRIIAMISERRPLFFFGLGGFSLVILGLLTGARTFQILAQTGELPVGTALLSLLLMTIGVSSGFTGIILYVLARRK